MKTRDARILAGFVFAALAVAGYAGMAGAKAHLRPTNVEVRILSQSCFQGEIEPCG
jgi:hypothetical protein